MANINIDTAKLRNNGNQIKKLTDEFNSIINLIFNRLEKMPTGTCEWTGKSAETFVNMIKKDKAQYNELKKELDKYSKFLCDTASSFENKMRTLNY